MDKIAHWPTSKPPQSIGDKLQKAKDWLGEKWVLHKANQVKKKEKVKK